MSEGTRETGGAKKIHAEQHTHTHTHIHSAHVWDMMYICVCVGMCGCALITELGARDPGGGGGATQVQVLSICTQPIWLVVAYTVTRRES